MLRLWHHVGDSPARAMLFEEFTLAGRPLGLIEAIVSTAQQGRWRGRLPRRLTSDGETWPDEVARLEEAFARSLADGLGPLASPMVQRAWRAALRVLLTNAV